MVDPKVPKTDDSAEKAYAAASEGVTAKSVPDTEEASLDVEAEEATPEATAAEVPPAPVESAATTEPAPVMMPAKAKRAPKPRAASVPATVEAIPAKPAAVKAKAAAKAKPAPKAKVVKKAPAKPAVKPAQPTISTTDKNTTISQLKDKIMATTTKTPDFTKGIQDVIADIQEKTKTAFEKSTVSLGEVTEFAKGNVEALVESGKIFAAGVQDLGTVYVSESRAAFEALTADVKELASSKTPADFLKLQSELLRRNFDAAVATGSKNSEAVLKLANEAFAPISGRFSLAVDKIKKAA